MLWTVQHRIYFLILLFIVYNLYKYIINNFRFPIVYRFYIGELCFALIFIELMSSPSSDPTSPTTLLSHLFAMKSWLVIAFANEVRIKHGCSIALWSPTFFFVWVSNFPREHLSKCFKECIGCHNGISLINAYAPWKLTYPIRLPILHQCIRQWDMHPRDIHTYYYHSPGLGQLTRIAHTHSPLLVFHNK